MSTQTPYFIGIVVTYFHVNIFKKFISLFSIHNNLSLLWKHSNSCILKFLFLSASVTELVKSLSIDAKRYCFIILYNFTFVLHFCVRVERIYFYKGRGKFHLHHTLKAYIQNMEVGVWRYIHCHTQTSLEIRS